MNVGNAELFAQPLQLSLAHRPDPHPVQRPRAVSDALHLRRDAYAGQTGADLVGLGGAVIRADLQEVCRAGDGGHPG